MGQLLSIFEQKVCNLAKWAAAASLILLISLTLTEVIMRYCLNRSTLIADEVGGYLVVCVAFLGLAHTLKSGGHIRIDFLLNVMPKKVADYLYVLTLFVTLVYGFVLGYRALLLILDSYKVEAISNTPVGLPLWIPQIFMLVGLITFIISILAEILRHIVSLLVSNHQRIK